MSVNRSSQFTSQQNTVNPDNQSEPLNHETASLESTLNWDKEWS